MSKQTLEKMVEVEFYDNGRIHIIHVNGMTRAAVDGYVDAVNRLMVESDDTLLLSVQNFAKLGGLISPYFLGRMKQIATETSSGRDVHGRVALVNSSDAFRLIFDPLLKLFSRTNQELDIRFFNKIDDAMQWVSDYQDD